MQKADHMINPGQAEKRGEFCLGYWDWGYQEPYNGDLTSETYRYIFSDKGIGTLNKGK